MTTSTRISSLRPLNIGMIGAGTIGGGVYEILMYRLGGSSSHTPPTTSQNVPTIRNPSLRRCIVRKICIRDQSKLRSFTIDESMTQIVTDTQDILDDEGIDIVVEVMGGTGVAREVVLEALKRGKSIVTANKALVAECLDEINEIVLGSAGKVRFAYEGAVCGGIPIIQALQDSFTGDVINEVMGICHGATNYMLGKMEEGLSYTDALKNAQDLGLMNEADAATDVEGHNVRAKIAILAKLAFGTTVPPCTIPTKGITSIRPIDFEYAKILHCTIKLIGTVTRLSEYGEHDGALTVYVSPQLVPNSHLLAPISGSGNAVAVNSANLGTTTYTGPGAGRFPTANSVVADVCRIANGTARCDPFPLESSSIVFDQDYSSCFYVRISFTDELGIIRKIGEMAERCGISINSVLQNPMKDRMVADCVVTTEECKLSQVTALCKEIEQYSFSRSSPLFMPLLSDGS